MTTTKTRVTALHLVNGQKVEVTRYFPGTPDFFDKYVNAPAKTPAKYVALAEIKSVERMQNRRWMIDTDLGAFSVSTSEKVTVVE
jgi:hypothetical protein